MKAIPALLLVAALLGLASGCGPMSFQGATPPASASPDPTDYPLVPHVARLNQLIGPATASVGLPATASVLIVYGSGAFKGKGYAEVEVDEALKTVTLRAFYLFTSNPHINVTGNMATDRAMVAFTPAATGTYQIQLANYIDWPLMGTATADVYVEAIAEVEE